uniref:Ig-like domain-containing protein n=1 Tax=Sander lucioperca TaxID=283035 RepID=A0A8D0AYH6_SANLU
HTHKSIFLVTEECCCGYLNNPTHVFTVNVQLCIVYTQAHSYYHNQDQLGLQDQHFRGRTSLFKDQISRGTASIRLTGVEVQDEGRYKCYTSTISDKKESYINLNVDENRITCSSEGIYPQPELTWSTSPLSDVSLENNPTVQQTEQLLYNINSSLIASVTDLVYSCTVSTLNGQFQSTDSFSISGDSTHVVGGVVGVLVVILAVAGLVWYYRRRRGKMTFSHHF